MMPGALSALTVVARWSLLPDFESAFQEGRKRKDNEKSYVN